jgi:hypothetical protein
MGRDSAVRTLLELGADISPGGEPALHALYDSKGLDASRIGIAEALLQQGADCLLPFDHGDSLLVRLLGEEAADTPPSDVELACLSHLERQRAAGQLELGSTERAAQLLEAAILASHPQLLQYGISSLEVLLAAEGGAPAAGHAFSLRAILRAAIYADRRSSPSSLQALLASRLPFELGQGFPGAPSLLANAALAEHSAAAKVQLLLQAGVHLTAADLLCLIERRLFKKFNRFEPPALATLLSVGMPAVDTSQPSQSLNGHTGFSCPIHRALHIMVRWHCWQCWL